MDAIIHCILAIRLRVVACIVLDNHCVSAIRSRVVLQSYSRIQNILECRLQNVLVPIAGYVHVSAQLTLTMRATSLSSLMLLIITTVMRRSRLHVHANDPLHQLVRLVTTAYLMIVRLHLLL